VDKIYTKLSFPLCHSKFEQQVSWEKQFMEIDRLCVFYIFHRLSSVQKPSPSSLNLNEKVLSCPCRCINVMTGFNYSSLHP